MTWKKWKVFVLFCASVGHLESWMTLTGWTVCSTSTSSLEQTCAGLASAILCSYISVTKALSPLLLYYAQWNSERNYLQSYLQTCSQSTSCGASSITLRHSSSSMGSHSFKCPSATSAEICLRQTFSLDLSGLVGVKCDSKNELAVPSVKHFDGRTQYATDGEDEMLLY